jgi:SAM-dependent methyltransferase
MIEPRAGYLQRCRFATGARGGLPGVVAAGRIILAHGFAPGGSFDATLAVLTIHHWTELDRGLRELRRVTRDRIVIVTWDPAARADLGYRLVVARSGRSMRLSSETRRTRTET